ncbi:MAG TPA: molybdopterin-dependent oxidoreductase [Candidatus Limnocylindria bacterium]|jgi:DMSO/TMAO reductase YedYZ molybdopterin-dependent catalytic subunit|nr:molybdopterin-dependent oxidoreductase [Candidatus Limnocylindria bacterium]
MPRRLVNLTLLAAVAMLLATGVIAWLLPEPAAAPLYAGHRVAGVALVLGLAWKYAIARRSLRRRGAATPSVWIGLASAVATVAAAGIGIAWTTGVVSFDRPLGYSALNLHVIAGLALGAILVAHALLRGESRPALVSLAGRRAVLRGLGLFAASLAVTAVIDRFALARRLTGSRHAGSFTGNAFPVTMWSFDRVPAIDVAAWRLRVSGAVARGAELSYADVVALPRREASAILDCTGGWWSEQVWSGISLGDLLAARGIADNATHVAVISVTGHRWTFDRREAERAILATHVGGETLAPGHGYPLRLVVPSLRGFLWIKWVREVAVA